MGSHGLPIDPGDLALLSGAGIGIDLDRDRDGLVHGGSIALPIVTHDRPTHVVLTLARSGAGGTYRIAIASDPETVLIRETRTLALDGDDLHRFGLLDGDARDLVGECRDVLTRSPDGPTQIEDRFDLRRPEIGVVDPSLSDHHGYRFSLTLHHASLRDCAYGTESGPDRDPDPAILAAMGRAVSAWVAAMAAMMARAGPTPLRRPSWTPEAAAHLADPEFGRNRRQAVSLYPAFAPFLAGHARHEETSALVDEGRPFEASLGLALSDWIHPLVPWNDEVPMGWPMAKLRRMRTMPGDLWGPDIHRLLRMARDLPADHLPSHAEGWRDMAYWARILDKSCAVHAMPLARLVLDAIERPVPPFYLDNALDDAADMIDAVRASIVVPCLDRPLPKRSWTESRISALLLFKGLDLHAILDASARWHADGTVITKPGSMEWTWPRLFTEFAAADGVRVVCLGSMRDLVNEGSHGEDLDGRHGLAHCIPTYAGQCLASKTHVASVRRMDGAGDWVRLSTVALVAKATATGMAISVRQHRGLRNAEPAPEETAAVDALLADLRHRPMPEDVAANDAGHGVAMDVTEADLPRLAAAWNPFVPRRHRTRSLDEARALIDSLADEVLRSP